MHPTLKFYLFKSVGIKIYNYFILIFGQEKTDLLFNSFGIFLEILGGVALIILFVICMKDYFNRKKKNI
jgi:hypothetical protein